MGELWVSMKSVNIKEKGTRNENFFFFGGGAGASMDGAVVLL